jgi:polar amino acid transport system substrate-binding protein
MVHYQQYQGRCSMNKTKAIFAFFFFSFISNVVMVSKVCMVSILSLLPLATATAAAIATATTIGTPITICTDSNFWYPFTYVKADNKQAAGLHINIISKALKNAGFEPTYKPMPWNQCLKAAKTGLVDAVATVSYKTDRTDYLEYPADAANTKPDAKSNERVTQVEYVVITSAVDAKGQPNAYNYEGNIKTIPTPVRIPAGYSIVDTLEIAGLKVEEHPHSIDNFKRLIKEKKGSVIDLQDVTKHLNIQPEFQGKLKVSDKPIFSKSYYLAFTKGGAVKEDNQKKIWSEIAKVREDSKEMATFLEKY